MQLQGWCEGHSLAMISWPISYSVVVSPTFTYKATFMHLQAPGYVVEGPGPGQPLTVRRASCSQGDGALTSRNLRSLLRPDAGPDRPGAGRGTVRNSATGGAVRIANHSVITAFCALELLQWVSGIRARLFPGRWERRRKVVARRQRLDEIFLDLAEQTAAAPDIAPAPRERTRRTLSMSASTMVPTFMR